MNNYIPLILGMALVTYIPRLIPLLILSEDNVNPKLREFLMYIPYTSLSILLIRGIIISSDEMRIPTIIGIIVAALIAYFKENLVLSVIGGIFTAFIIINILGI